MKRTFKLYKYPTVEKSPYTNNVITAYNIIDFMLFRLKGSPLKNITAIDKRIITSLMLSPFSCAQQSVNDYLVVVTSLNSVASQWTVKLVIT